MPTTTPTTPAETANIRFVTSLVGEDGTFYIRTTPDGGVAATYKGETGVGRTREDAIRDLAVKIGLQRVFGQPGSP